MSAEGASNDRPRLMPSGGYPLLVLGGGPAGSAAAREAARRGIRVALVLPGGESARWPESTPLSERTCFLHGCMGQLTPSEPPDDPAIDVYRGRAVFCRGRAVAVGGREIRFRKALLATGTRPAPAAIDGAGQCDCLRVETLEQLDELPGRLAVIGHGPAACGCAQAFRRLGCDVYLIDREQTVLPEEEPDAALLLTAQMQQEGIRLCLGCRDLAIEPTGNLQSVIVDHNGRKEKLLVDRILLCGPRLPNTAGLGLESVGVAYSDQGVAIGDRLQTTHRHVYAAGGVCGARYASPQAAAATARLAVHNALRFAGRRLSRLVIPHCLHTDPAIARVGLTRREAAAAEVEIDTYRTDLPAQGEAITADNGRGLIMVHVRRAGGSVVGATVAAHAADELTAPLVLLMTHQWPLMALADVIACRPSRFEQLTELGRQCRADRHARRPTGLIGRCKTWWSRHAMIGDNRSGE